MKSSDLLVVCLHGFLGTGKDWNSLTEYFQFTFKDLKIEFWCPDLLSKNTNLGPDNEFSNWIENFNKELSEKKFKKSVLIGYSMGGRLALNFLSRYSHVFNAVILMSTHPGIFEKEEVMDRRQWEVSWQEKFKTMIWENLIQDWEKLEVFTKSENNIFLRKESDFSREYLALALSSWSPTKHLFKDLNFIKKINPLIFWLAGEEDKKYVQILSQLKIQGFANQSWLALHCGHRLGIIKNEIVFNKICEFVKKGCL